MNSSPVSSKKHKVILVGLQLPSVDLESHQSSLAELGRLAETLGFEVIGTLSQRRKFPVASTVIGQGKLQELAHYTGGSGIVKGHGATGDEEDDLVEDNIDIDDNLNTVKDKADKVIFDDELSPTQLRNLESATGVEVLDRNGVIIEIFHRHARTREARIQVEIARLRYLAPRLRISRVGQDRQGGGIGSKGVGETAHELDRRRIRDRIAELTHELESIHDNQVERRSRRKDQLKVALVGYTNAGKSSLMRALTATDVLVEDKLFATLDTTVRAMQPATCPRILVSDTVGFIKKLPHDLVASFRSTLDEAQDASVLLYVVDASDPTFREQLEVTRNVLSELDLHTEDSLIILNKIDRLEPEDIQRLLREFPGALAISTRNLADISRVRSWIIEYFEKDMVDQDIRIPYEKGHLVGEVHSLMRVLHESHDEVATTLRVRGFPLAIASIVKKLLD